MCVPTRNGSMHLGYGIPPLDMPSAFLENRRFFVRLNPLRNRTAMPIQPSVPHSLVRFLPLVTLLCSAATVSFAEEPSTSPPSEPSAGKSPIWRPLFDGKSLKGWKKADFPGGGDVVVKEGQIVLEAGMDITGVTIDQKIPKVNYEVEFKAMRVDGSDFFCGLTFPMKDDFCSLIVGGWGGGVVGLSSLSGMDASENQTTTYREFENGKWYPIKLRVTDKRISAWIEDKEMVDVGIDDQTLSTRIEVEWSKPFGFASWQTKAALKDIKIRELSPAEVEKVNATVPEF